MPPSGEEPKITQPIQANPDVSGTAIQRLIDQLKG